MEIFITKKSEKFIETSKEVSNETDEQKWSADIFLVDRKKCLIITHKKTLYTFFVLNLLKKDLKNIQEFISNSVQHQLKIDEIDFQKAKKYFVLDSGLKIDFLRTDNDQKTLGWLRDLLFITKLEMDDNKSAKMDQVIYFARHMNERLVGSRDYKSPIQMLNENL